MLHRISVIITAHHRRNYLIKSVKSVINQDFSRDDFEIIVVKNFFDGDIDLFLNENNIKSIYTENESPGAKIAVGIQNCDGELLTFLDDDDEYTPERLKVASAEFETNPGLIYYHNSMSFVDDSGKPVTPLRLLNKTRVEINKPLGMLRNALNHSGDFNCSSIMIRSSKVSPHLLQTLLEVPLAADTTIFLMCADLNQPMLLDERELTRYRVHQNNSFFAGGDFKEFQTRFLHNSLAYLQTYQVLYGKTNTDEVRKCVECSLENNRVKSLISQMESRGKISTKSLFILAKCALGFDRRENLMVIKWAILSYFNREMALRTIYQGIIKKYEKN